MDNTRSDHLLFKGTVIDAQRDKFRVVLEGTNQIVVATLAGKLRMNKIRILVDDEVQIAVSTYDTTRGIIKARL